LPPEAVLIDIKASPWRFFGVGNVTIVPYVLVAMTFGYLATYLYLLPAHILAASDVRRLARLQRTLRVSLAAVVLLFCGVVSVLNFRQTNHRGTSFISLYADRLLDNLEGRSWLATNGVLDDVLLLRARERGIPLNCLNLAEANNKVAIRIAKQKLGSIRLKNTVELGFVSLLQEWITSEPTAGHDLALALVPDLWGLGEYEMLPRGLLFLGATQEEMKAVSLPELVAHHEALWEEMGASLAMVPDSATDAVRFYRDRIVRPQTSFVGNNLGFVLESMGQPAEAFKVYERMHAFDPDNVSALLNWATMVFNGRAPEKKDAVFKDLEALSKRLEGSQLPIWSLSRVFGYVSRPEQFAQLGWSWAGSGQPRLALDALKRAEASTPAQHRTALKSSMAKIHMLRDRPEESERVYFEMLVEDAGNREALMGLVRLFTMRGDAVRAREFLARADKAGVPRVPLLIATALVTRIEGDPARARSILQEQVDLDPSNIEAWGHLCALLTDEQDAKALEAAVGKLEEAAGTEAYVTLIARAGQALLLKDLRAARDFYSRAHRLQPTAVILLEQMLNLDFQLADKTLGAEHARMLLRLDNKNSFANYIMGSLAVDRRDYEAAEDYLRVSVEGGQTVANLNDLAVVLLRRNQIEEAELRIQQAFKLDDQNYAAWDTFGMIRLAKGELDEAEMAFNTALKHEAEDLRVHVHLAEALFRKNQTERAGEILRAVAKVVDTLPREEWERFEELHLKVLGVKFARAK
jgi:tetratricopeptide (TPR) repeat protein